MREDFKLYQNKGTDGHDYLYMYWQRTNILGSANMDFEFNQRTCTANFQTPGTASTDPDCANNGVLPKTAPQNAGKVQYITPLRTAGDLLFTFDFASGGNQVNLNLLTWVTSGAASQCEASNSLPCWGNKVVLNGSGNADGAVNTDESDPLFQKQGEAALDLTDTVFKDKCLSIGSAYLKSRSATSFTAASKDFVPPSTANISNCGKVIIRKNTVPPDTDQDFNYTSMLNREGTTGDNPVFKLNAKDTATQNTVPQSITFGDVQVNASATYSVTETLTGTGAPPAGWTLDSINCSAGNVVPDSTNLATGVVTFKITKASDVLDCTYTNKLAVANVGTEQTYIPQDLATITGSGLKFDGTVDFKLHSGTAPSEANCGTANDTNPTLFEKSVQLDPGQPAPHTAYTNNDGDPTSGTKDAVTIDTSNDAQAYYWEVTYRLDSSGALPRTTCVENTTAFTITNG